jgi:hypothetical protein
MFRYDHLHFRREPFPIGLARRILDESTYRELLASYPPIERFTALTKVGTKYTLSERFNPRDYADVIRTTPAWREFHRYVKSDAFIASLLETLREHHIDLGFDISRSRVLRRLGVLLAAVRGQGSREPLLTSRFEFSMLPAKGGHVIPHTDGPSKIVTLVLTMVDDDEWESSWGGGTDVVWPRDVERSFNQVNAQLDFDEVDVIDTFEFAPNQAVVFIKTFNSWHAVRPMTGSDPNAMRRTLTINIENPS